MVSENCHITSAFRTPKLRQFVRRWDARRSRPHCGGFRDGVHGADARWSWHQRPLPSVESARARFTAPVLGSLMRTTAASLAPGPARVFVRTEVSYCSVIQRLEAIAGDPAASRNSQ